MEKPKSSYSSWLKLLLKIAISSAALYYVFSKIDIDEVSQLAQTLNLIWLVPATLFFALSKLASAYRLNYYFRTAGLQISEKYNLRLYVIGMYYNLFLPGGIGGDGYKVYLLNKQNEDVKLKTLVSATLLDRINGLFALLILALLLTLFLPEYWEFQYYGVSFLLLVGAPGYYLLVKLLFPTFLGDTTITTLYSLLVQILQVICAYFILLSLSVDQGYVSYQFVFLISSIVAVFPFTIGGVGARELTFVLSHQYLGIDQNVAVAFSLLFFLITALVSLIGAFLSEKP